MNSVPLIDLFAGPGGLSEGFSAHMGATSFRIALSIEKDAAAHRTLELRSFFRQFPYGEAPELYYRYIRGEGVSREALFEAYPAQASIAADVAWYATLGEVSMSEVIRRVERALDGAAHWVLLGGPPCQAYSIAGRARMKGMEGFKTDHRHTLYREYLKILAAFRPTVFVMENVKGILSSRHQDKAIFGRILEDMRNPWRALRAADRKHIPHPESNNGYRIFSFSTPAIWDMQLRPSDYVIESERYGLPQKRHRVILLGIRDDYDVVPPVIEPAGQVVTVRDVIGGLPRLRSRLSEGERDGQFWARAVAKGRRSMKVGPEGRPLAKEIERELGHIPTDLDGGSCFVPAGEPPRALSKWLWDPRVGGAIQHETRAHMPSDLHRYFFAACFAAKHGRSPKVHEFPKALWPNHANVIPDEHGRVNEFADRFRVQLWDAAATTITAHLAKDGHYFIHPDPLQCRSLTVREAARLQTFPDNYFFEGNRGDQFRQIGNAVPPFLAYQLADVVAEVLDQCLDQDVKRSPTANVVYAAG
ncbi:MAG: DNA cytosine methyltransferase [Pseudomonadota bacterium]